MSKAATLNAIMERRRKSIIRILEDVFRQFEEEQELELKNAAWKLFAEYRLYRITDSEALAEASRLMEKQRKH